MRLLRSWFLSDPVDLHALQLDPLGWPLHEENKYERLWRAAQFPAQLSKHFFPRVPDLPAHPSLMDRLIPFYQKKLKKPQAGIIEISPVVIQELDAIRTLFKFPLSSGGYLYLASLTIPFANYSYVIKVQSQEFQDIGGREREVRKRWERKNQDPSAAWTCPPFPNLAKGPHSMNESDKREYDRIFAQHPLSQVRRWLPKVEKSLQLDPALYDLAPFRKGLKKKSPKARGSQG
ncbi:MAG: hypothetical protein AAFR61_02770 [Bacteroidota bacterium]